MRILLAALLALLLAAPAYAVGPAGFTEAAKLEPAASYVAGKPVKVWCGIPKISGAYVYGSTVPGTSDVQLTKGLVCQPLLRDLAGKRPVTEDMALALMALVHEATHARGVWSEAEAQCAALKQMASVGILYFGLRGQRLYLRRMMAAAYEDQALLPAQYQSPDGCQPA